MHLSYLFPLLPLAVTAADSVYFNLDAAINTPFIQGFLDTNLRRLSNESMWPTSRITTTVLSWRDVPGPVRPRASLSHSPDAAVIRADVNVHVVPPTKLCLEVDGYITYYLFPVWEGTRVQLRPDAWDTHTDLLSACQDRVNNEMKKQVGKPETIQGISQLVEFFVFNTWTVKQRWISTTKGTLSLDRELPGKLPPVGPGCGTPKPPPQCPPPRPVNKPPVRCELKDKEDGCGTKVCECRSLDD